MLSIIRMRTNDRKTGEREGLALALSIGMALALSLPLAAEDSAQINREAALALVWRVPASDLDEALPERPLREWLADVVGPDVPIDWELNDCGEQTGNPAADRSRDIPECVAARVALSGDRVAVIQLIVGSLERGLADAPTVRVVYLIGSDGMRRLDRLGNLQEAAEDGQLFRDLTLEALRRARIDGVHLVQGQFRDRENLIGYELLEEPLAFGDINGDGVEDAAAVLVTTNEGSVGLASLAVFVADAEGARLAAQAYLGDRTAVDALVIEAGEIQVTGREHGPGDARCCPTAPFETRYRLDGDRLVEVDR
jgi:hypothetical protein